MMWSVEEGIQRKTEGQKPREVVEAEEDSRLLFPMSSAILVNQRDRIAFIKQLTNKLNRLCFRQALLMNQIILRCYDYYIWLEL